MVFVVIKDKTGDVNSINFSPDVNRGRVQLCKITNSKYITTDIFKNNNEEKIGGKIEKINNDVDFIPAKKNKIYDEHTFTKRRLKQYVSKNSRNRIVE